MCSAESSSRLNHRRVGAIRGITDQQIYFAQRCQRVLEGLFCKPHFVACFQRLPLVWPIAAELQQEWRQLQTSPALLHALSDEMQQSYASGNFTGNLQAQAAELPKHKCAFCDAQEAVRGDYKACARCHCAFYCGREHQLAHWKTHKKTCSKPK